MQFPSSLQTAVENMKLSFSRALQRTRFFYRSHWMIVASGFTIASVLLILWARLGFTLELNRFFAAPVHTPSALSVQCGTTKNVLTWTLPDGHDSNSVLRNVDAGNGMWVCGGPNAIPPCNSASVTTYTDTDIQPGHVYTYRHKAWADTASNTVTCSTQATPTPSPTLSPIVTALPPPTPFPTITPVTTPTPSATPTPTPVGVPSISLAGENVSVSGGEARVVSLRTGQVAEIRARVRNTTGVGNLTGVVVTAQLPEGIRLVSGSTTVAGIPTSVDTITTVGLSLGMIGPGQEVLVTFRVTAISSEVAVGTTQGQLMMRLQSYGAQDRSDVIVVAIQKPEPGTTGSVETGPGDAIIVALLLSSIVTLLYVSYTHTSSYRRREVDSISDGRDPLDFRS